MSSQQLPNLGKVTGTEIWRRGEPGAEHFGRYRPGRRVLRTFRNTTTADGF
jgi:hypothetical protein